MNSLEKIEDKISIYIGEDVKESLKKYAYKTLRENREYGGILLGRVSEEGDVFIEIATHPTIFDISTYLSFIRKKSPSQLIIDRLWKRSNGKINYFGEWHTHPFKSNKPSCGDIRMIRESFEYNQLILGFMIMIITDTSGKFSITLANSEEIVTKEDCNNDELFYEF